MWNNGYLLGAKEQTLCEGPVSLLAGSRANTRSRIKEQNSIELAELHWLEVALSLL